MEKEYKQPTLEVININTNHQLLSGSNTTMNVYGTPGQGNVYGRQIDYDDEYEW